MRIMVINYQPQSIGPRTTLDIRNDVPVWQPRADGAKLEQRLRNPEERCDVRVGEILPRYDLAVKPLRETRVSSAFRRNGELPHTRLILSRSAAVCVRKA